LILATCLAAPVAAHATDASMDSPLYAMAVVKSVLNWLHHVVAKPTATPPDGKFGAGHSSDGHIKDSSVVRAPAY
jgi:hypothetical protein